MPQRFIANSSPAVLSRTTNFTIETVPTKPCLREIRYLLQVATSIQIIVFLEAAKHWLWHEYQWSGNRFDLRPGMLCLRLIISVRPRSRT
jgi:hypothetical protein